MKKFLALTLALIMALSLVACGGQKEETPKEDEKAATSEQKDTEKKVFQVGVCTRAFSSPWQTYCYDVMKEVAAQYPDIELDFQDGQEDANVQVNILQTFIEQKKDLVVVFANQTDTLTAAVNQVADAGIPVINTQGWIGDGANILTFIGSDDYVNGWGQGQVLHELLKKDGKEDSAKIILIQALLGTTYTTDRTAGLEAYIAENLPGVEIIAYEPCDNDNAKTVTAMQNLLTRFPAGEVDAVVVQGPHDCVAAADAAIDAGRDELRGKFVAMDYATLLPKRPDTPSRRRSRYAGTCSQRPSCRPYTVSLLYVFCP